jgi:PKD repeat protein
VSANDRTDRGANERTGPVTGNARSHLAYASSPRRPLVGRAAVARSACLLSFAAALLVALPVLPDLPGSSGTPPPTGLRPNGSGLTFFPTPIHHVIVIWFENRALGQVLRQNAPFEHYIASHYAYAGQFYSVRHDSEPDYLAGTGGIDPNFFSDGRYTTKNIGDLTKAANETWAGYFEGMPYPCDGSQTSLEWSQGYEVTHDPFVQYSDIWDSPSYCQSHVLNLTAWNTSLQSGTIPNYAMIEPDIWHDQHSGTLAAGDAWLQSIVDPILNSSLASSTAIFVTYDESQNGGLGGSPIDDSGFNSSFGGNVFTGVISPYSKLGGYNSSHPYQTYSLLTTTEWLLGLGQTGTGDNWSLYPPMYDLFNFHPKDTVPGPDHISGVVTNSTTGLPLGGAHIVAADASYVYGVDAGTNGSFRLPLTAGTHPVWVASPNHYAQQLNWTANLTVNVSLVPFTVNEYPIYGWVTDAATHAPVRNAVVTFTGCGSDRNSPTNGTGYFSWSVTPCRFYNVTAQAANYVPQVKSDVNVSTHRVLVNFSLLPVNCATCHAPLVVSATAIPNAGFAPLLVNFTSAIAGGAAPYRCGWSFGDGSRNSSLCNATHVYERPGVYNVTITVRDSSTPVETNGTNLTITVVGGPLRVGLWANRTSGDPPLSVRFAANASGGTPPYAYLWSFGDGAPGSNRSTPSHTFGRPGTYVVRVNVTDTAGNVTSNETTVTVLGGVPPPSALNVTAVLDQGACQGTVYGITASVNATGGVPPYVYAWSFGDGSPAATGGLAVHSFPGPGTYTVTVTATDHRGREANASLSIAAPACGTGGGLPGVPSLPWWTIGVGAVVVAAAGGVAAALFRRRSLASARGSRTTR